MDRTCLVCKKDFTDDIPESEQVVCEGEFPEVTWNVCGDCLTFKESDPKLEARIERLMDRIERVSGTRPLEPTIGIRHTTVIGHRGAVNEYDRACFFFKFPSTSQFADKTLVLRAWKEGYASRWKQADRTRQHIARFFQIPDDHDFRGHYLRGELAIP